jgi:hypothetical protein
MAIRFISKATVKNKLPRSSNIWDGTAVFVQSSYESIATVTVGSGGASNITFSSIPSTYTHLQLRVTARDSGSAGAASVSIRVNGDSGSNYTGHQLYATGSVVGSSTLGSLPTTNAQPIYIIDNTAASNIFGISIVDILDANNTTKNKTFRALTGYDTNGGGIIIMRSAMWMNTSAITSMVLTPDTGFTQYSQIALYGIKGA